MRIYEDSSSAQAAGGGGFTPRMVFQSDAFLGNESTSTRVDLANANDAYAIGLELMTAGAPSLGLNTLLDVSGGGELVAFCSPELLRTAGHECEIVVTVDGVTYSFDPDAVGRATDLYVLMVFPTSFDVGGSARGVQIYPADYYGGPGLVFSSSLKIEANFTNTTAAYADSQWVYGIREETGWA